MNEIRGLIREVLAEELARIKPELARLPAPVREEKIRILNDADLSNFVSRLLSLFQDERTRSDISNGRYLFRLDAPAGTAPRTAPQARGRAPDAPASANAIPVFDSGMITERDVNNLDRQTRSINVGKTVRFTPLAKDELRRRNISIVRRDI